jgi:hypothetical protein
MKTTALAVIVLFFAQGCATAGGAVVGGAAGTLMGATLFQKPTEVNIDTGEETTPPFDKDTMLTSALIGAAVGGVIGMIFDLASMDNSSSGSSSYVSADAVEAFNHGLQQGPCLDGQMYIASQGGCIWLQQQPSPYGAQPYTPDPIHWNSRGEAYVPDGHGGHERAPEWD